MSSAFENLNSELAQAVRHARGKSEVRIRIRKSWSGFSYFIDLTSYFFSREKLAAAKTGRNSIGIDIDPAYCRMAERRLERETRSLFGQATVTLEEPAAHVRPASEAVQP